MGAGIVLLIWIIVFAVVSGILGGICFFIVYLIVRKKPYKNKGFLYALSLLTPFIFLFSELFIGLIGECFVTDKVDCGSCWFMVGYYTENQKRKRPSNRQRLD